MSMVDWLIKLLGGVTRRENKAVRKSLEEVTKENEQLKNRIDCIQIENDELRDSIEIWKAKVKCLETEMHGYNLLMRR